MSASISTAVKARDERSGATSVSNQASPNWLIVYYVIQIGCQLALLTSVFSTARIFFRSSAYSTSLLALAVTINRRKGMRHPASRLALITLGILALEAFNPSTGSALGALATVAMYAAILGPVFWVPRLRLTIEWFHRVVLFIWAFQFLSAFVGALQVYYPGIFQPTFATPLSDEYIASLSVTLSSGERILRPSGLTDTPGGAAGAGTYAILLALGLWSQRPGRVLRATLALSIATGMFVLYICQIRSLVVMVGISIAAMVGVHILSGRFRKMVGISTTFGGLAIASFIAAVSVGGDDVTRRLSTLTASSPTEVYYTNRGIFLEHTLSDLLPRYPLGAGLARWGMLFDYFGGGQSELIYAEIQWTGWLLDGGILLMVIYALMLAVMLSSVGKLALRSNADGFEDLAAWAAMLVGYDVGTIALTLNFPVFMSAFGFDFWLLNTTLLAVAAQKIVPDSGAFGALVSRPSRSR